MSDAAVGEAALLKNLTAGGKFTIKIAPENAKLMKPSDWPIFSNAIQTNFGAIPAVIGFLWTTVPELKDSEKFVDIEASHESVIPTVVKREHGNEAAEKMTVRPPETAYQQARPSFSSPTRSHLHLHQQLKMGRLNEFLCKSKGRKEKGLQAGRDQLMFVKILTQLLMTIFRSANRRHYQSLQRQVTN